MSKRIYTWAEAFRKVADRGIPLGQLFSHGPKKCREQFVAAIFTCAMEKLTGHTGWNLKVVEDDPPDFVVWCAKYPDRVFKVENLQIPENVLREDKNITEQVYKQIDKKLKKYGNVSNYILCVYLRFNGPVNFLGIHKKFQQLQPNSGQIWIIATTNKKQTIWHCEEVWPGAQKVKIDLEEELKKLGKTLTTRSLS